MASIANLMLTAFIDSESPHKNANNDDPQVYTCSRPKCQRTKKPKKKKTSNPEPPSDGSNTYVVEAFIGRFTKVVGGRGKQTFYLVKWHGYVAAQNDA